MLIVVALIGSGFVDYGYGPLRRVRQPLRFQPVVEFVDSVIARFALFAHAPAMTAGVKNVKFHLMLVHYAPAQRPTIFCSCSG